MKEYSPSPTGRLGEAVRQLLGALAAGLFTLAGGSLALAQTAALVPNAKQQFFNSNGQPLAGGSVYSYVPNTTTPKSTWVDPNEVTLNASPVTLDSSGGAFIFGQGNYRQIVKDSSGNTIWDGFTSAYGSSAPSGANGTDTAPVGSIMPFSGFAVPTNWQLAYGQALSRTTYATLQTAITISTTTGGCTASSTTVTGFTDTSLIRIGAPIESSCLPTGDTVASIVSTTSITVASAATATGTFTVTVFPWGNGDGVSTFNVPDLRGRVLPGPDAMGGTAASRLTSAYYGVSPAAAGASGGSQSKTASTTIAASNVPTITASGGNSITVTTSAGSAFPEASTSGGLGNGTATSTAPGGNNFPFAGSGIQWSFSNSLSGTNTITTSSTNTGGGSPAAAVSANFATIQPSITMNYIIKVTPNTTGGGGVTSLGGMFGDIVCGQGVTCAALGSPAVNTIECSLALFNAVGCVQPDNSTITISGSGVISAIGAAQNITVGTTVVTGGPGVLSNSTSGGALQALTNTQITALVNPFSSLLSGATPASGGGTTNFLRADGTWALPIVVGATVASITALRALTVPANDTVINVEGYYTAGDGGGGFFLYNSSSVSTDNGGSVIAPTVGSGRYLRQVSVANTYTPEMFGAYHDGGTHDDGPFIDNLGVYLSGLPNGGTIQLSCGTTYTINSYSGNGVSAIRSFSKVNIVGCGEDSKIMIGNGVNASSSQFINGIYNTSTLNDWRAANFVLDMNGANNSCGGTCYHSNVGIGAVAGDNITVSGIKFLNNPGSNDTVFGSDVGVPTVTNLNLIGNVHEHYGDIVNPASLDFSADFFIATNVTMTNIRYSDGPRVNGAAFELHGGNITASNLTVTDNFNCGIIAAENVANALTTNVAVSNVTCKNMQSGLQIATKAGAQTLNVTLTNISESFLSGAAGWGIDACSLQDPASITNTNLTINGLVYYSSVTSALSTDTYAVSACRWNQIHISGVQSTNTQGGAVFIDQIYAGAIISLDDIHAFSPGHTATVADQVAVRFANTAGTAAGNISITNVTSVGTVQYNISSAVSATQAAIDSTSTGSGVTIAQWNVPAGWSGVLLPQTTFNFRGSGGANQVVQQSSAGGGFSVGQLSYANISGQHNTYSTLIFNSGNAANPCLQNSTYYFTTSQCYSAETATDTPLPQSVTLDKLYCTAVTAPPAGQTFTITLRKNFAATAVTCQITSASVFCSPDITHSASYVAGDTFDLQTVNSATSGTAVLACSLRQTVLSP